MHRAARGWLSVVRAGLPGSSDVSAGVAEADSIRDTIGGWAMKTLICTVGLPRSGKTTWARQQGYPIVSPDSIRVTLHGKRYDKDREEEVWILARQMIRALFRAGNDTVVLDACLTSKKRRDPWSSCPDGEHWDTRFKVINTPKEECLRRASLEQDEYIVPSIERMSAQYQPLDETEKPWEEFMAHHGDDPEAFADLKKLTDLFAPREPNPFGATGKFPQGHLNRDDEGELQFGVANDGEKVIIKFGKPIAWLGMTADQAIEFGSLLIEHAGKICARVR